MAISGDFANFRTVYDDLTNEVMRSHVQFLADHLANWFQTLDTTRDVAQIIQRLQSGIDFEEWRKQQDTASQFGGVLTWPKEPEKRLGMQLLLFRSAADAGNADIISGYGYRFLPSQDRSINNAAQRFIDQVFRPMASELRRYLERETANIPAADRSVALNHNSKEYAEVVETAEKVEKAIQGANDFPDEHEREQRIAEVSALRRLLQAASIRIEPIVALLRPIAEQAKTKLKDTLVGMIVNKLLALLGTLIQYIWPF